MGTSTDDGGSGTVVTRIDRANVMLFRAVDFGSGRTEFAASLASEAAEAKYAIRLDSPVGTKIGTLSVTPTGSTDRFETQTVAVTAASGVRDVYLVPSGGRRLGSLDWIALR